MFGRSSFIAMLLAGAFLPYLLSSESGVRETVMRPFQSSAGASDKGNGAAPPNAPPPADPHASALYATHAAAAGAPLTPKAPSISDERLVPFENALQWRITPTWVLTTWPRVTTQLSELELQGYRVTFVTGTTPTDIAGVLTYYFDAKQVLQRITFNGTTGDARRLVQFLASAHRFERRLLEDPSVYLYQVEQDRRALSELKIKTAPIVRAGGELSRFEVSLVMRRPEE